MTRRLNQHPQNPDGTYQMCCAGCGTYVDDSPTEPPVDYLCDDCLERI